MHLCRCGGFDFLLGEKCLSVAIHNISCPFDSYGTSAGAAVILFEVLPINDHFCEILTK